MASYRTSNKGDRLKALAAVLLVHLVLGALLLSGLNVRSVTHVVDRLRTFDLALEPPPPPVEPSAPADEGSSAADEAAPENVRSRSSAVVAPEPRVRQPLPPERTAETAGASGPDRTSGASAQPGSGTGAGGQGSGSGGGGAGGSGGAGSGGTPARLLRNISDRDYRGISGDRLAAGRAAVRIRVGVDGRATACRPVETSGDPQVDARICSLVERRLRFSPARDETGRAVATEVTYIASWSR